MPNNTGNGSSSSTGSSSSSRRRKNAFDMANGRKAATQQPPAIDPNAIYRTRDLPALLRVGRETVDLAIKKGHLKFKLAGNARIFRGQWLLDFLEVGDTTQKSAPLTPAGTTA